MVSRWWTFSGGRSGAPARRSRMGGAHGHCPHPVCGGRPASERPTVSSDTPTKRKLRLPSFSVQIVLGLVLGVALGYVALRIGKVDAETENALTTTLDTIGSSFVGLLKAIVPPLVFTAIVASIANLRKVTNAARLAGQTLLWFAITTAIAVAIGIGIGLFTNTGMNTSIIANHYDDLIRFV